MDAPRSHHLRRSPTARSAPATRRGPRRRPASTHSRPPSSLLTTKRHHSSSESHPPPPLAQRGGEHRWFVDTSESENRWGSTVRKPIHFAPPKPLLPFAAAL